MPDRDLGQKLALIVGLVLTVVMARRYLASKGTPTIGEKASSNPLYSLYARWHRDPAESRRACC